MDDSAQRHEIAEELRKSQERTAIAQTVAPASRRLSWKVLCINKVLCMNAVMRVARRAAAHDCGAGRVFPHPLQPRPKSLEISRSL